MLAGVTRLVDVLELLHQRLVDREPAGGVEDHDVAPCAAAACLRLAADRDRVLALGREHRHLELAAERLELLDGGGPIDVGRDEHRLLLVVFSR